MQQLAFTSRPVPAPGAGQGLRQARKAAPLQAARPSSQRLAARPSQRLAVATSAAAAPGTLSADTQTKKTDYSVALLFE